ncbi:MAG: hypothetical protein R3E66_15800 [bacterium]
MGCVTLFAIVIRAVGLDRDALFGECSHGGSEAGRYLYLVKSRLTKVVVGLVMLFIAPAC